ncbi:MAG TPA: ABC transporter permease [Mucilaginibacter sp.]|nr:ABC transporter permease [Mucilaginibacter sp.]
MIRNYFKTAWRNIAKHRSNTLINVLGLALGICSALVIFLIVSSELSYDNFHPDKDRIYRIVTDQQDNTTGNTDHIAGSISGLPMAVRNELTGFESVTAFYNYYAGVSIKNAAGQTVKKFDPVRFGEEASPLIVAEPQYFDLFKYQWLQGNPATVLSEPFKVVLSESEANKYFGPGGSGKAIGKTILYRDAILNDSLTLTVSGIVKDWAGHTDFGFRDFISAATIQHSFLKNLIQLDHWGNWSGTAQGFVKLAKGTGTDHVEKQFQAFTDRHIPPYPGHKVMLKLQPLSDVHFNNAYHDFYSRQAHLPTLYGLIAIAAFILIIAIINFVNLSTARSLYRAREIGVRKVLGSTRNGLVLQFLTETFLLTLFAVTVSVLMVFPVLSSFHTLIPVSVSLNLASPFTLLFLVVITLVTTVLAGFYPAKVLSSYKPVLTLKGQSPSVPNNRAYLRKGLIVFQFTVSLIFVIGTIIVGDQLHFILNKDLGFNKEAIVTFYTAFNNPSQRAEVFAQKLKALPGVTRASIHWDAPAAKVHSNTHFELTTAPDIKLSAAYEIGDQNYVPLFGLNLVAGRNISGPDKAGEFLINETGMRQLGFKNPEDIIGKTARSGIDDLTGTIVGVVKDFNAYSLHETIAPFFITSNKDMEKAISIRLVAKDGAISSFKKNIAKVQDIWKELYPNEKFEYHFFDESIAKLYESEEKTSALMNIAMVIAIFISCMGLFGLATFTARQRMKEIAVRKVLGASVSGIVALLNRDFVGLVGIAILIASPVAYYFMHAWLQDFAYRVPISVWVFLLSGAAAVLIALITISFQSIKAAISNPIKSLRNE